MDVGCNLICFPSFFFIARLVATTSAGKYVIVVVPVWLFHVTNGCALLTSPVIHVALSPEPPP